MLWPMCPAGFEQDPGFWPSVMKEQLAWREYLQSGPFVHAGLMELLIKICLCMGVAKGLGSRPSTSLGEAHYACVL